MAKEKINKVTVTARMPIYHDGVLYQPGDQFEIQEAAFAPLLAVAACEPLPEAPVEADA